MDFWVLDDSERKRRQEMQKKNQTAGAHSWDARHRSTTFLLGAGQSSVQTVKLLRCFSWQNNAEENKKDKSVKSRSRQGP